MQLDRKKKQLQAGLRKCPDYLVELITYKLGKEELINGGKVMKKYAVMHRYVDIPRRTRRDDADEAIAREDSDGGHVLSYHDTLDEAHEALSTHRGCTTSVVNRCVLEVCLYYIAEYNEEYEEYEEYERADWSESAEFWDDEPEPDDE
jgi:hypothetical protein